MRRCSPEVRQLEAINRQQRVGDRAREDARCSKLSHDPVEHDMLANLDWRPANNLANLSGRAHRSWFQLAPDASLDLEVPNINQ